MFSSLFRAPIELLTRLKKQVKRRRKIRHADVLVVSQAKSGRTWLAVMISHVYHRRHAIDEREIVRFDNFRRIDGRVPSIGFSHDNRKDAQHSPLLDPGDLRGCRTLLLVRDPRDVVVSAYFQSLRNEGGFGGEPPPLFDYVVRDKLPQVIDFLKRWAQQLPELEQALIVRYEDLRAAPEQELTRIMTFIDGRAPAPDEIRAAVEFAAFDNLRRREAEGFFGTSRLQPGDAADADSFKVRRGKVGGYRDYFDDRQIEEIEAMMAAADFECFGYRAAPQPTGETVATP